MGSIKWKMATLYMILLVTVMAGCGALILYNLRNNAYQDAFKEVDYTAQRIIDVLGIESGDEWESPEKIFGEVLTTVMMESVNTEGEESTDKVICLLDSQGHLLYNREKELTQADVASRAVMDAQMGMQPKSLYIHTDYSQRQVGDYAKSFSLPQSTEDYIILIRVSMDNVQGSIRNATNIIFVSTALGIVVAGILGYYFAVNISNPILRLTRKTQQLASGQLMEIQQESLPEKSEEKSSDELMRLETHFDHMAQELSGVILELQQMERLQKEFVANVSHELRTPITTVKSYVETILDGEMEDPQLTRQFLQVVSKESDRMAALITDLLELSKMDSHQTQLRKVPVEMGQLVLDTMLRFEWEAGKKQQNFVWEPNMEIRWQEENGGDLSALPEEFWVQGESRRIEQVLRNLLTNAMKYSPEGATIEAGVYREAGEILVMIRDSGIGISEEDQKRIFDRFYRVDKARSRAMGGTGLGLSIAKEIMELHGGRIWVNSEPGQGSEFWLAFPEQLALVERGMLP